jgi:hypothetical protein
MIRINLLAEEQAAEELRRRDPVKRAIWWAGFVVLLAIGWVVWSQLQVYQSASLLEAVQGQWKAMEAQDNLIKTNLWKTGEVERKLAALEKLSTNRFLWSAPLNALQYCTISNIQLTLLTAIQNYNTNEMVKDPKTGKLLAILCREENSMMITGEDFAPEHEGNHVKYTRKIAEHPYFAETLRKTEPFTGITRAGKGPEAADSSHGARFSFTLWYPAKSR